MKKLVTRCLIGLILTVGIVLGVNYRPDIPFETLKRTYSIPTSQFVDIDGMPVHYSIEGEGIPLVLLHGTASSLHTWEGWTSVLRQDFKVIRLDLPAFGLTGPDPKNRYQVTDYVAFLHNFLTKIKVNRFHLAGNSLGGNIAWEYTLAYPEEVEKLILLDASGMPTNGKRPYIFELARNPLTSLIVQYVTPQFIFQNNLEQVYENDSKITPALITRYYELNRRAGNRKAFVERAKMEFKSNYQQLSTIQQPTLILWGSEDKWVPLEFGQQFKAAIPNSQLTVYPNVGHVPMEEIPEISVKDAMHFLKG